MKKLMVALLAVLTCAALAPQVMAQRRVQAADTKADGPEMKETLKWLKRYLNEEAGGQFGPALPADAPSGATGPRYSYSYLWIDKDWTPPDEATVEWQIDFTDRSTDKTTQTNFSLKLKGLNLDGLSVFESKLGGYGLKIPLSEAVTVTRDGKEVRRAACTIMFPTQDVARKACRALRRAALLAGAVEATDPFASDSPKNPVVGRPGDDPITIPPPPPPDDKAARRAALDAEIATAGDAVSQGEKKLTDLTGKIIAAKLIVLTADSAYQKAEPGSFDEALAGAALATAQGVLDALIDEKEGVESDLRADRDRLNQLKRTRARLGD